MIHRRSISFKQYFSKLPTSIQEEAKARFLLLKENPANPILHFKEFRSTGGGIHNDGTFSVRVNSNYRALGTEVAKGVIVWWFIGDHHAYMKLAVKSYKPKKLHEAWQVKQVALEVQQALIDAGCETHSLKLMNGGRIISIPGISVPFTAPNGDELACHIANDSDWEMALLKKNGDTYEYTTDPSFDGDNISALIALIKSKYS